MIYLISALAGYSTVLTVYYFALRTRLLNERTKHRARANELEDARWRWQEKFLNLEAHHARIACEKIAVHHARLARVKTAKADKRRRRNRAS